MFDDIIKKMKLDKDLRNGVGQLGRIGKMLNYNNLSEETKEIVISKIEYFQSAQQLSNIEIFLENMGRLTDDTVREIMEMDFTIIPAKVPKLPINWYRLASKGLNRLKQLTNDGRITSKVRCEESNEHIQEEWDGEPLSRINEQHIVANKYLFILDKSVDVPVRTIEQLKTEIVAIDVSGSMDEMERWLPAQLFLFNRIQSAKEGKIILKVILFGSYARMLQCDGSDTFTKNSNFDALERLAQQLQPTDGSTNLNSALELAGKIINPNGKNTLTIFTDEGSSFSRQYVPKRTMVNAICVVENDSLMELTSITGGRYYKHTEILM